ncbi:MAG: sigma-54-dependent Fis family transcriptional regulator [Deltaproteobacteria bacterium]|nr:sigma-54-dependent Fis family transcriptional regulator [Deltaproteobacteria bacterium]
MVAKRKSSSAKAGMEASLPGRGLRVLVVDDAEGIRTYLANLLELSGYDVDSAEDGKRALALLNGGAAPDVVILDVMMPGIDGIETLRRIKERHASVPVIMLSVVGKASTIVEAMQLGASDYINKPFEEEELQLTIDKVLEKKTLERQREMLSKELQRYRDGVVWASPAMQEIRAVLEQVGETNVTVLIQGESGVGKEIIARTAHSVSTRSEHPFVKVNCAALPADLLESELFGYEKGAFTGAAQRKAGKFEHAHKGTIFLDEIGEMSGPLQAKLLQVLQDHEFTRLGGNVEVKVDLRVVCATNRNLDEMVADGAFRADLFFRLNVVNITVPPLRDRREEIPTLIESFSHRYSVLYGRPLPTISAELMDAFNRYSFPGNVRELENLIKRVIVLESDRQVLADMLDRERGKPAGYSALAEFIEHSEKTAGEMPLREVGRRAAQEAERETIGQMLRFTDWNRKQAAGLLGISYKTLLQKIRGCGLEPG